MGPKPPTGPRRHAAPEDTTPDDESARWAPDPVLRAAISHFAQDGTHATLRNIAADAQVSAALLVKRYGSKKGLREACDREVLARIVHLKELNVAGVAAGTFMSSAPGNADQALLVRYIVQAMLHGGPAGREFLEHMIVDAEGYTRTAVDMGVAKASRDETARARYLMLSGLGAVLLSTQLAGTDHDMTDDELLARINSEISPPMLELYSQGFFTDGTNIEEYL